MYIYGSTLPIVGGVFAAVVAAILDVKFLIAAESIQAYMVAGFLSGFSERFTRNILSIAEGRFTSTTTVRRDPAVIPR
jgi:hypothetical protein